MKIEFYKYQGTGNDFIMIDNRCNAFDRNNHQKVVELCERRFGIGADGLILIENAEGYDFEVVYFNADATQSLCGNGSRCAVKFAEYLGIINSQTTFLAIDGGHEAVIEGDIVKLKMNDVNEVEQGGDYFLIDTGSPHYIQFLDDNQNIDIVERGRAIRYNDRFKKQGVNVNFVQVKGEKSLNVRTYERGVEGETFSCGTGVTACAIAHGINQGFKGKQTIDIETKGGALSIDLNIIENNKVADIWLNGPGKAVYSGLFHI